MAADRRQQRRGIRGLSPNKRKVGASLHCLPILANGAGGRERSAACIPPPAARERSERHRRPQERPRGVLEDLPGRRARRLSAAKFDGKAGIYSRAQQKSRENGSGGGHQSGSSLQQRRRSERQGYSYPRPGRRLSEAAGERGSSNLFQMRGISG